MPEHLTISAEELAERIILFPGTNPGCLLDEHKRADSIYLRRKWIDLHNADAREMASKVEAVNNAVDLYNAAPFAANQAAIERSKAELAAYRELIKERNEAKKFAADLHMSERATCHFFRPPQQDCLRAPITEIQREDGSVSEDPGDITDGHRISKGGLGLTPIKIFIQATHLKCLRDGIAAANEAGQAPRWLLPALEIFSDALGSLGYGFDILYADMKSTQWSGIPEYWRSTLRLWADLQTSHGTTNWRDFTQFMPLWFNTHFTFGKGKLPLSMVSKETNSALKALGFVRLHDFVEQFGDFATAELLSTLLDEEDFSRPASRTRLIKDTIARFGLIVPQEGPHYGPVRSTLVESACHGWSFGDWDVIYMANRHFVRLLLEARSHQALPLLPLDRLHLASFTPTDDTWCREIAWDQHVLPVCADLKFRLQHNTLGFRYKFAWRTEVDTSTDCVHGCEAIEDAQHLFWLCPIACFQWDIYLAPFADLTHEDLGWRHVMFPGAFQLRTSIVERFGDFAIRATFNIVRCCVLRALWLHRNKRLYNPAVSTSSQFVKHHAAAYIQLHLRQYRRQAWKDGLKKSVKWVDHIGMVLGMVVKTMSDPSTIPTSLPSYSTATESTVSTVSSASPIATETLPDLFRTLDLNRRA
ncbi:hypothetical protein P3T76_015604 [Phytophthora citrophthora]|uniref:Reverse transcriptase zinc-binding domain-containing protein n=1 Tax=Phytophthora citrophthora TaxID=4793 RepID=A0AAD9FZ67_9STRA|nr:hypothetical protein P3T76_015604 [Phytophthora citrophthora]